jgi:hypothetical protein
MRGTVRVPVFQAWADHLTAWLDRRTSAMLAGIAGPRDLTIRTDPEAHFVQGWLLCDAGSHKEGLEFLQRAVAKGYFAAATLASSQQFDKLRGDLAFQALLADAVAGRQRALTAFRETVGERLLGQLVSA